MELRYSTVITLNGADCFSGDLGQRLRVQRMDTGRDIAAYATSGRLTYLEDPGSGDRATGRGMYRSSVSTCAMSVGEGCWVRLLTQPTLDERWLVSQW